MAFRPHQNRALLILALVAVGSGPILFWGAFAGDALVHMVFMENASLGHFFEFNRGEPVSGETSPGYMILGAILFRFLPAAAIPIALKSIGLLAWYAFCWFVYRAATRLLAVEPTRPPAWSLVATIVAATLPGSVYNANVGMENGLFAALIWGWVVLADQRHWFDAKTGTVLQEIVLGSLLGLSCWLRPEGAVVAIVAYAFRLARSRVDWPRVLAGIMCLAIVGGASVAFQHSYTNDVIATSILSRRVLAIPNFVSIGPFAFDPTFAKRLLTYFPLTSLFVWGLAKGGAVESTERFLQLLLAAFFVLYTITGAPQLARYVIFLMPIMVIGAIRGARAAWRHRYGRQLVAIGALVTIAMELTETRYRMKLYGSAQLIDAMAAPARRRTRTDEAIRELENPAHIPIVVATASVQIRYELDDRIMVRSLDGRVDRTLLDFAYRRRVDHLGYLKSRRVEYLLQAVSFNQEQSEWSLVELRRIKPGATLHRDGVTFRRLGSRMGYAVTMQ